MPGHGPPTKWKKGQSGNLNGRPKSSLLISELAMEHVPAAIQALVDALKDPDRAIPTAIAILDRAFGKPPLAVLAHVNGHVAVAGGVDRPLPIEGETDDECLACRRTELALLTQPQPPTIDHANGAPPPSNGPKPQQR
jgi:hypothetical protein